ncbi:MAG: xanthine dehydrogenase family protein molybdopterin-binding subunit [Aigarchaeota archaeon]|nr:xanthine dehydrogenase family protein molybdopterin-binding subunit [Aigarchaeota archaeon]MDW8092073.1 xanthine dehydrogenase family protein molybdopterin-binding subunit [Nitrososphaerota archaeon]
MGVTVLEQRRWIGKPVKRVEDSRLIKGLGDFIDDLSEFRNAYHLAVFRSPIPHGIIKRVDVSRALKYPGVVAALTGRDVLETSDPFPVGILNPPKYYSMAINKVRYVGEPVAAIIARDKYSAYDATELVDFEYEPLKHVIDPEDAIKSDAPLLHEELGSNVVWHRKLSYGNVSEAFASADRIVTTKVRFPRYSSVPLEPFAAVAYYDKASGVMTIYCNFHGPWTMYSVLSKALRLPEDRLRVITTRDIGGGFGIKSSIYPFLTLVALAAKKVDGPVKWIETRREHLLSGSSHSERVATLEAAVKNDGTILGIRHKIIDDVGAYIRAPEPGCVLRGLGNNVGAYKFRNLEIDAYIVVTNKIQTGPNRGYNCQHLYFGLERLVDKIAYELQMDPAEVRFRNLIPPEMMPYTTPTGGIYDSGDYPTLLKTALNLIDYGRFREEQKRALAEGRYLGVGLAVIVDPAGSNMGYVTVAYPPEFRARSDYLPKSGTANLARIRMLPNGKFVVKSDVNPQGQGHETSISQIVAEELGVDISDVIVDTWLDSFTDPWTVSTGNYSSRFAAVHASAVALAARKLKDKIFEIAAALLNCNKNDLAVRDGNVYSTREPGRSISLKRIAGTVYWNPSSLPSNIEPLLEASAAFNIPLVKAPAPDDTVNSSATYASAADAVKVEVDIETGEVKILKYVSVHDCGRIINPIIVEGQIIGSLLHGIAGALYEELVYDKETGQPLSSTFADYLCPTASEMPMNIEIDHLETPSPLTILGAKGTGEASTESAPVAVANAVEDALRPLGVTVNELPLYSWRVWELIRRARERVR